MVSSGTAFESFVKDAQAQVGNGSGVDPVAVLEALTGLKLDRLDKRQSAGLSPSRAGSEDYEILDDQQGPNEGRGPRPDQQPKDVNVGCINPYALVETLLGRRVDRRTTVSARIISDVLQTDYDELFDMRNNSVLFAGLRLNMDERRAEELPDKDIRILEERDLVTPDFSRIQKVSDLERAGMKEIGNARVKMARVQNGKLRLVLEAHHFFRTVSNRAVTRSLAELTLPCRDRQECRGWTPPNSSWRNMEDTQDSRMELRRRNSRVDIFRLGSRGEPENVFDDPVQGASSNCWLIAAMFSVFWADPCVINRATSGGMGMINRDGGRRIERDERDERRMMLTIRFHDKGGKNNNKTEMVAVDYQIPVNNSSNEPVYCRSSDGTEIWPALYEKAFAKWVSGQGSQRPDIRLTHHGDPVKAMAQINGREPMYYRCENHSANDLVGLVRMSSVNFKTINPMAAWTHATGSVYRGANIVANHAYSVLGWSSRGERQYIILRNPWGVSEPSGLNSYPGLVDCVEPELWRPACLLDSAGVMALEINAFKEYFAYIGVAM